MRNLLFFLSLVAFFACANTVQKSKTPLEYVSQGDYIVLLKDSIIKLNLSIVKANDSIAKLNKRIMTSDLFLQLYKYDRLLKYYRICKKNPTQWKYYKGWSIRVFEQ